MTSDSVHIRRSLAPSPGKLGRHHIQFGRDFLERIDSDQVQEVRQASRQSLEQRCGRRWLTELGADCRDDAVRIAPGERRRGSAKRGLNPCCANSAASTSLGRATKSRNCGSRDARHVRMVFLGTHSDCTASRVSSSIRSVAARHPFMQVTRPLDARFEIGVIDKDVVSQCRVGRPHRRLVHGKSEVLIFEL